MKGFLIGLGIGVGLGVLFAPMSGEETRNNLVDRASDLSDSAREMIDQGKERSITAGHGHRRQRLEF
jgi:gas vesicle protein